MKKTRLLILLLVFALTFTALVACKKDNGENTPTSPAVCDEHVDLTEDGICDFCGQEMPIVCDTHKDTALDGTCDVCNEAYSTVTVAKALELCGEPGNITEERYYIRATVKTVSNVSYGEMYIEDESGEIYVYGTYDFDGVKTFAQLDNKPQRGDTVVLACILQNYNGTKEVKNARLVGYIHNEADISDYTEMDIATARTKDAGELIIVDGVVARITYADGYKPCGVILVDETGSIYVYGADVAGNAQIGNKIKVAAVKDYWILDTEKNSANKFGYKGCNQLSDAILIENDKGNHDFDKTSIEETTVKTIMDTPVTEDITTKIFKVNALVKKVVGTGFTNYYIDDIDGKTGSYVYTQCSGGDFAWLDEFDGKICTVYLTALNAKSNASGCVWRFLPIAVKDEGYTFDVNNAAEYTVTYHGLTQFLSKYTGDPAIILDTVISSELLGFNGATLTYSSSNEDVIYFTNEDGIITFHGKNAGTATVTVTAKHNEKTHTGTVEITILENIDVDFITVEEAIATPKDTDVVVKGIVGPSLVNQTGFYLFGEDGSMIAVRVDASAFEGLSIGNEVIISGMRERYIKDDSYESYGQDAIVNGVIIANYYGNHEYSTEKFITGKTLADIKNLDITESHSTEVYVVKAVVEVIETQYFTNLKITYDGVELTLYCKSASQYNWLKQYAGQEITIEVAPCNWNDKKDCYRGCVLAVVHDDGTKTYNTLNFN